MPGQRRHLDTPISSCSPSSWSLVILPKITCCGLRSYEPHRDYEDVWPDRAPELSSWAQAVGHASPASTNSTPVANNRGAPTTRGRLDEERAARHIRSTRRHRHPPVAIAHGYGSARPRLSAHGRRDRRVARAVEHPHARRRERIDRVDAAAAAPLAQAEKTVGEVRAQVRASYSPWYSAVMASCCSSLVHLPAD